METLPTLTQTLIGLLSIIMLIFGIIASVFVAFYLFSWQKMRAWFNKKAASEFMPEKRIEQPQIIAAVAGAAMAVVTIIYSMIGPAKVNAGVTPMTVIFAIVQWGALIWFVIYCKKIYKQRVAQMGKQTAKWSAIYLLCSCTTIVMVSAVLSGYVIAIYALLFIVDKVWNSSMKSGATGSTSSDTPQYKCCSSCQRFSYGKCNDNPSALISDPSHHCCGGYTA